MDPIYIVGALLGAIFALTEALKWRNVRKNGINGGFSAHDRQMLNTLHTQHQKVDRDGTPLWYVPRRMLGDQEKQKETLIQILAELKALNRTMANKPCLYETRFKKEGG